MISKTISLLLVLVFSQTFVISEREHIDDIPRENSPALNAFIRNETNDYSILHYEGGNKDEKTGNDSSSGVGIVTGVIVA